MKITRVLAVGILAATMGIAAAQAQSLKNADEPAEFPPSSFKGKQYVDSRGCVYIRAGIDGLTTWVPRVARSRKVLCGYQPTFAKAAPTKPDPKRIETAKVIAPVAKPATGTKPAVKPKPIPVAATAKPAAKAKPVVATKPVRKTKVRRTAPVKVAVAPTRLRTQPRTIKQPRAVKIAPTPAVQKKPRSAPADNKAVRARKPIKLTAQTSCKGVTGISRYYAGVSTKELPVRCGPQAEPFATVISRKPATVIRNGKSVVVKRRVAVRVKRQSALTATAAGNTASSGTSGQRLVPRHVYGMQQAARTPAITVPPGYRPAWKDDRLNPKRAHQTETGIRKTDLAWTRTVPRKLYERATGRVVNRFHPKLVYPYTSMEEQRQAQASGVRLSTMSQPAVQKKTKTRTQVTRAATSRTSTKAQVAGRYVQIGVFSNLENARRSAKRIAALGLPARTGKLVKAGREYRIVLAGPFAPNQLGGALAKARKAGYGDAFIRK